mgnify:CR=1 FL=1
MAAPCLQVLSVLSVGTPSYAIPAPPPPCWFCSESEDFAQGVSALGQMTGLTQLAMLTALKVCGETWRAVALQRQHTFPPLCTAVRAGTSEVHECIPIVCVLAYIAGAVKAPRHFSCGGP